MIPHGRVLSDCMVWHAPVVAQGASRTVSYAPNVHMYVPDKVMQMVRKLPLVRAVVTSVTFPPPCHTIPQSDTSAHCELLPFGQVARTLRGECWTLVEVMLASSESVVGTSSGRRPRLEVVVFAAVA